MRYSVISFFFLLYPLFFFYLGTGSRQPRLILRIILSRTRLIHLVISFFTLLSGSKPRYEVFPWENVRLPLRRGGSHRTGVYGQPESNNDRVSLQRTHKVSLKLGSSEREKENRGEEIRLNFIVNYTWDLCLVKNSSKTELHELLLGVLYSL